MTEVTVSREAPTRRGLNLTLWILQALLAAVFLMAGLTKAAQPMAALATKMPWTAQVGEPLTRFIGVSEILGALGLILPAATRFLAFLTPLAAAALTLIMALATGFHLSRGEMHAFPIPLVIGVLCAFVAFGRFKMVPVAKRD
jgi:putative oxidoreductase